MCFSATASFSAGAVLLVIGGMTVRHTHIPAEFPFALVPMLFGVQQLLEGMLWLTFANPAPTSGYLCTQAYSVFSQLLWPAYIPVSVLLLERVPWRRQPLIFTAFSGAAVSLFLLYYLVHQPVVAVVNGHHIAYIFPHFHEVFASGLYLMAACIAPLLSSHPWVRLFGVAVTVALIVTYAFYTAWFISVWCFFSALLSGIVYMHFSKQDAAQNDSKDPTAVMSG